MQIEVFADDESTARAAAKSIAAETYTAVAARSQLGGHPCSASGRTCGAGGAPR